MNELSRDLLVQRNPFDNRPLGHLVGDHHEHRY